MVTEAERECIFAEGLFFIQFIVAVALAVDPHSDSATARALHHLHTYTQDSHTSRSFSLHRCSRQMNASGTDTSPTAAASTRCGMLWVARMRRRTLVITVTRHTVPAYYLQQVTEVALAAHAALCDAAGGDITRNCAHQ
jgi:hypothetical protein